MSPVLLWYVAKVFRASSVFPILYIHRGLREMISDADTAYI